MPTVTKVAEAGIWLQEKAKFKRPIGMDLTVLEGLYHIEFADLLPGDEQAWEGTVGDTGCQMLAAALAGWAEKPSMVVVDLPGAVADIVTLTSLTPRAVTERLLGDMEAIEATLGPIGSEYSAREALRQWRGIETMPMPSYYEAIAKPLQRMKAAGVADGLGWEVSYSELFLRVVAHYSRDPQLVQALIQDEYPPQSYLTQQLSGLYDGITEEHAFACILMTALGGDLDYVKANYPEHGRLVEALGNTEKLLHNLDKMIPSIRLMATALSTIPPEGYFSTMYGRRLAYRVSTRMPMPGQYLDHILAGTVEDLISILCVTMANQGASVGVPSVDPLEHSISIRGTTKERDMLYWIGQMRQLATLAGPLMPVPLGATVGRADA